MKCLIIIITIISPLVGRILQMDRAATNTIAAGSKVAQRATRGDPPHDHHHARERATMIITVGHYLVDIVVDVATAVRVPLTVEVLAGVAVRVLILRAGINVAVGARVLILRAGINVAVGARIPILRAGIGEVVKTDAPVPVLQAGIDASIVDTAVLVLRVAIDTAVDRAVHVPKAASVPASATIPHPLKRGRPEMNYLSLRGHDDMVLSTQHRSLLERYRSQRIEIISSVARVTDITGIHAFAENTNAATCRCVFDVAAQAIYLKDAGGAIPTLTTAPSSFTIAVKVLAL